MVIINIRELLQVRNTTNEWVAGKEMALLPSIENSFIRFTNDLISDFGPMSQYAQIEGEEIIDAEQGLVMPAFVDSHSHLIFAETREAEFVDKIKGASYTEIAAKGGGILNSALKLQELSEEELFYRTMPRVEEVLRYGTACLEIKSGYGLTTRDELKMLRVARRIGEETPLTIKTTFLGAHAIPKEYSRSAYLDLVIKEMIPAVAEEGLADYVDVFCENGFFNPEESERVILAAKTYGMKAKVHANQLGVSGGVEVGVKNGALSVDHLECIGDEQIAVLKNSKTMPTLLPGSAFYLNNSYPPARRMIDSGLPVALATDYNPGSAPAGKMAFMISLASIKMKMTPEEAINAATINGAYAMDVLNSHGTIAKGKKASIIIFKSDTTIASIPYAFTGDLIRNVIIDGQVEFTNFY